MYVNGEIKIKHILSHTHHICNSSIHTLHMEHTGNRSVHMIHLYILLISKVCTHIYIAVHKNCKRKKRSGNYNLKCLLHFTKLHLFALIYDLYILNESQMEF